MENQLLKKLAYHEAGHLFICLLLRKIQFQITIKFPSPKSIYINDLEESNGCLGGGNVENSGFPITPFRVDDVHRQGDALVVSSLIFDHKFYPNNKKIAIAQVLLYLAGHVADVCFVSGNHYFGSEGEANDKSCVDRLIPFAIKTTYKDTVTDEYWKEVNETQFNMINDLRSFFLQNEKVIHFIAERLLRIEPEIDGKRKMKGIQFVEFLEEVDRQLENFDFEPYIKKYEG